MRPYRVAVNLEWTSKCNARCAMCPRQAIPRPEAMSAATFERALDRISPADVFRVVIAGYGEPTTHPRFDAFVERLRRHPVPFDMVSNGQLLDPGRIARLDGALRMLMISFSSIDPDVYRRVHVGLDQRRVMDNILAAKAGLRRTALAISLTPLPECIASLPRTVAWLRGHGVGLLTMSPTLYDRGGRFDAGASANLRDAMRRHGLRSQEYDFVPSVREILAQRLANRFACMPRNSDLLISAQGRYMFCFNDIAHGHELGDVAAMTLRDALRRRERSGPIAGLCDRCNVRGRYRGSELPRAALDYLRWRWSPPVSPARPGG